ncbi:hypothetical protein SDC9_25139 [bioreactor metagenome]|uniref:Uncharacterized protein n=1 Tax=bioreactor metagenome TaxID=1076179 RepID=A0A644UKF5_9ZZZZ
MSSIFDGLSGIFAGMLGGVVLHLPRGGTEREVQAIFREPPIVIEGDDGHDVLDVAPVLRVPAPAAAEILVGDRVQPEDGRVYRVVSRQPGFSPATDALVTFVLELDG